MRILHVTGAYPLPPLGGMEATVVALAEALAMRGEEVRVVAPSDRASVVRTDRVEYHGVPAVRLSSWVQVPTGRAYRVLRDDVRWADVVHIHNPPELFCFLASRIAARYRRPVVASVVSPGTLRHHPRLAGRLLGSIDEYLVLLQLRSAAIVQVQNPPDAAFVSSVTDRGRLLPHGVPEDFFAAPRVGRALADEIGWHDRHPLLLYLGRVHPMKGPDHFVRAAIELRTRKPELGALLVGPSTSDSERALLGEIARGGATQFVRYLGPVSAERRRAALDAADVLVVPSLADFVEGFSLVSSEAWARGKPVAAYAVGALRSRVSEGVNGALAPPGDPVALAQAIERALELRSFELPGDVVPWSRVVEVYAAWYSEVARPGRGAERGVAS